MDVSSSKSNVAVTFGLCIFSLCFQGKIGTKVMQKLTASMTNIIISLINRVSFAR